MGLEICKQAVREARKVVVDFNIQYVWGCFKNS